MLPVSLDCPFLITDSVFSNVYLYTMYSRDRRVLDRMVVGYTTTCAISAYNHHNSLSPVHDKVYSIQQ
jgi:hypothetical protein